MISIEEAQRRLWNDLKPFETENIPLADADGRVVSETVLAPIDVPPFDNSAMDGYAVRSEDVRHASTTTPILLRVANHVPAGAGQQPSIQSGDAARVFTGSMLPPGADAVVMQEDTEPDPLDRTRIRVLDAARPLENIRLRGEDIKRASLIATPGQELGFAQLAALAAAGVSQLRVYTQPLVGILATGSELREPGQVLEPGQIYESNRLALAAMLRRNQVGVRLFPLVGDTLSETESALEQAFASCDAVITSGGVSVGDHDHVKAAFERIGGVIEFWRLSMKPGKPFVFGKRRTSCLFGLPGNPVSAAVVFHVLVRPALARLRGLMHWQPRRISATLGETLNNRGDRRHFVRVQLAADGTVRSAGAQASHMLHSLAGSHGLVEVPANTTLTAGSLVLLDPWD